MQADEWMCTRAYRRVKNHTHTHTHTHSLPVMTTQKGDSFFLIMDRTDYCGGEWVGMTLSSEGRQELFSPTPGTHCGRSEKEAVVRSTQ